MIPIGKKILIGFAVVVAVLLVVLLGKNALIALFGVGGTAAVVRKRRAAAPRKDREVDFAIVERAEEAQKVAEAEPLVPDPITGDPLENASKWVDKNPL